MAVLQSPSPINISPLIDLYKITPETKLQNMREDAVKSKLFELDSDLTVLYEMEYPLPDFKLYKPDFTTDLTIGTGTKKGCVIVFEPHFIKTWADGRVIMSEESRLYTFSDHWRKNVYHVLISGMSGTGGNKELPADEIWFVPNGWYGTENAMRSAIDKHMEKFVEEQGVKRDSGPLTELLRKVAEGNMRQRLRSVRIGN